MHAEEEIGYENDYEIGNRDDDGYSLQIKFQQPTILKKKEAQISV